MGRLIVCKGCGEEKLHKAKGLCGTCYSRPYIRRWCREHKDDILARQRQRYKENPEKARLACRKWRKRNRDREIIRGKQYRKDYPERAEASCRRWREKNPEKVAFYSARRRARRKVLPDTLTFDQSKLLLDVFPCFYCGSKEDLTLDHFVPIVGGGGTTRANMTVSCKRCNSSKNSKLPREIFVQLPLEGIKHG